MDEDVFINDIDSVEAERMIGLRDIQLENENLAKMKYSEGFLSTCDLEDKEIYNASFTRGKDYSLNFGKLIGKINCLIDLTVNYKLLPGITKEDIDELMSLKSDTENYMQELKEEDLKALNSRFITIFSKYVQ